VPWCVGTAALERRNLYTARTLVDGRDTSSLGRQDRGDEQAQSFHVRGHFADAGLVAGGRSVCVALDLASHHEVCSGWSGGTKQCGRREIDGRRDGEQTSRVADGWTLSRTSCSRCSSCSSCCRYKRTMGGRVSGWFERSRGRQGGRHGDVICLSSLETGDLYRSCSSSAASDAR
jgi:hypothetical protein